LFTDLGFSFLRAPNPWLAAMGYVLFGAVLGGVSLMVFPNILVPEMWRVANLFVTPIAVGSMMVLMGAWCVRRGPARAAHRPVRLWLLVRAFGQIGQVQLCRVTPSPLSQRPVLKVALVKSHRCRHRIVHIAAEPVIVASEF
jgi:hypothetical protein